MMNNHLRIFISTRIVIIKSYKVLNKINKKNLINKQNKKKLFMMQNKNNIKKRIKINNKRIL